MSFHNTNILRCATFDNYGYYPEDLSDGSHKTALVKCINCALVYNKEYRNRDTKHQCCIVKDGKKKCFKCNTRKCLSLFNKNPSGSGGAAKLCSSCYRNEPSVKAADKRRTPKYKESLSNNISHYMNIRYSRLKARCKTRGLIFSLTKKDLYNLWILQNGKCYYTNLPMIGSGYVNNFQAWDSPSVDRLIPSRGYIKGNIVWCISAVNAFKSTLTEKEFIEKLSNIKWRF